MARRPRHARGKRSRPVGARVDGRKPGAVTLVSPPTNQETTVPAALPTKPGPMPDEPLASSESASGPRAIVWQVRGCAALCALAAAAGLLYLVGELSLQMGGARDAVGWSATAICAGVACGLWMPRRIIRRRLQMHGRDGTAAHSSVEFEFAATLTGVLILTLGTLWVLLVGLASGMESYRMFLSRGSLHPPGLTLALILTPLLMGMTLLGAVGTTVLVALHGWQRLTAGAGAGVTTLWLVMLLAGTMGVGGAWLTARSEALAAQTLLATFGAVILAVCRKPAGAARPAIRPTTARHLIGQPMTLLGVVATALATGIALATAVPLDIMTIRAAAGGMGVLGVGVLLGMLLARRLARMVPAIADEPPLLLLVTGIVWSWPGIGAVDGYTNIVRVGLMGSVAAGGAVLAGRRVAAASGGVQPAVARVGGALALGLSLGLLLGSAWLRWQPPPTVAIITAIVTTATAGIAWLRQNAGGGGLRTAGLTAAGIWLTVLGFQAGRVASADANHEASARVDEAREIVRVGRGLLESPQLNAIIVASDAATHGTSRMPGWHTDLAGSDYDIVIVTRPSSGNAPPLPPGHARRLLHRCNAALLVGGRLAIELPADDLAAAALDLKSVGGVRIAPGGHLVHVRGAGGEYAVLLRGRDVPSWIHDWARLADCVVQHRQVSDVADLHKPDDTWQPAVEAQPSGVAEVPAGG